MHVLSNPRRSLALLATGTLVLLASSPASALVPRETLEAAPAPIEMAPAPMEPAPAQPAFPAQPGTPLPPDSEFDQTPSSYLQECRLDGVVFDPPDPQDGRCPLSGTWYDGANCYVATVPSGLTGFVYSGNLYTSPRRNRCTIGGFDGANCHVSYYTSDVWIPHTAGMELRYYSTNSGCLQGTKIGSISIGFSYRAICRVATAPTGSEGPFLYNNSFYYKPLLATQPCTVGSYDGANCYVATPPYGTTPFVWQGNLYHTPFTGPPVAFMGNQLRYRGIFATIYMHGRNTATSGGPIYGWGYTSWAQGQKGTQPIWLAWDSTSRISQTKANVAANLDLVCGGPDLPCHVVCHSAGCLMITLQLAENPDRWNIASVTAIQGAQGGSEIADIGMSLPQWIKDLASYFGVTFPIDYDLRTSAARSLYNHHQTDGVPIVTASGDWDPLNYVPGCDWWQWIIASPYCLGIEIWNGVVSSVNSWMSAVFKGGGHDAVLANHSTAGFVSAVGSNTTCSSVGYWTNYDSIHRRGHCYPGLDGAMHMDGWKLLQNFGTIPP